MSARTPTRTPGAVDARLPWWALALPVAAFAALLLLATGPGRTHASGGEPAVGRIAQQIQHTLSR
ncbi:hypothetical protein [Streptomyces sp. DH12]|uniref:hypothetical protein n=1 Tax=Streptomyces sp. DH12 TaxID=2857010 RepID=UPI001E61AFC0|nr:hypothetical protein [Streptomyces sp. DH12]